MTLVFDSHSFVKRLTAAGMPEAQAEALAGEHSRWFDDGLATKADVRDLAKTSDLIDFAKKTELKEMELRLEVRIEAMKSDILKWMFGTIGLQTLALLAAIVTLAKAIH
jgi:hypothetical protein